MSHFRTTVKGKVSSVSMSANGRAIKGKKTIRKFWTREIGHTKRTGLKQVVAFSENPHGMIKGKIAVWDKNKQVSSVNFTEMGGTKFKHIVVEGVKTNEIYQKEGIATQVLSEIISIAKRKPLIKSIVLTVRMDNPKAITVYRKLGFTEYSFFKEVQGGERVDCMAMRLDLAK